MQQYTKKLSATPRHRTVAEDVTPRLDTLRLAQRLQWTESLLEEQRRELRRVTAELNELREFVNNKLRR